MSTETVERVGVSTFTEIVEQMDFHLACELPEHGHDAKGHAGDAAWLARLTCAECHYSEERLVCDQWRVYMSKGGVIDCGTCLAEEPAEVWYARQTWIKL